MTQLTISRWRETTLSSLQHPLWVSWEKDEVNFPSFRIEFPLRRRCYHRSLHVLLLWKESRWSRIGSDKIDEKKTAEQRFDVSWMLSIFTCFSSQFPIHPSCSFLPALFGVCLCLVAFQQILTLAFLSIFWLDFFLSRINFLEKREEISSTPISRRRLHHHVCVESSSQSLFSSGCYLSRVQFQCSFTLLFLHPFCLLLLWCSIPPQRGLQSIPLIENIKKED